VLRSGRLVDGAKRKPPICRGLLNADALETSLKIERVRLINDFQSVGYGVDALRMKTSLPPAWHRAASGNTRHIGAGTGWARHSWSGQGEHYEIVHRKAGTLISRRLRHQVELLRYLRRRYRATWERVVSGRGL
jgi:glucokinase